VATNAAATPTSIELVEQFGNFKLVTFIEKSDIESSPEWNPAVDAPPLSVAEAIRIAVQLSDDSVKPDDVKEIDLRPVPNHDTRWHYLIMFADEAKQSGLSFFVVLMNGKVIPAVIEPRV
jgi:hypothetical protein